MEAIPMTGNVIIIVSQTRLCTNQISSRWCRFETETFIGDFKIKISDPTVTVARFGPWR